MVTFASIIVILLSIRGVGGEGIFCPDKYGFQNINTNFAIQFGQSTNLAFIENYGDYDGSVPSIANFDGAGSTSEYFYSTYDTIACRGWFWFRCCPIDGSYYASSGCAGVKMSYSRKNFGEWLLPSGVTCTPCPAKPAAHTAWTGSCGWGCVDGYSRQGMACECPANKFIDAQNLCQTCPAIANGVSTYSTVNRNACSYACNAGFFQYSLCSCSPCIIPTNTRLLYINPLSTCAAACMEGYYYTSQSCALCGFNQYRAWNPVVVDAGCTQVTSLTASQAYACSEGQYYILAKSGPTGDNSWISCAACTAPPANTYYVRDIYTKMTALTTTPNACITKQCPIPPTPGVYTRGCGGTSMGETVACCTGLPYSCTLFFGFYDAQGINDAPCPIRVCTPCMGNYYNLGCPVNGGISPGECKPCSSVANGVVYESPGMNCPYTCNTGFYRYTFLLEGYVPYGCFPCINSAACATPGYYKDASYCMTDVWNDPIVLMDPNTGSFIGTTYVSPSDGDGPCFPCPSFVGMAPLTSLPQLGNAACRWECDVGYYLPYTSANYCATCGVTPVCGTGQYVLAECRLWRGTTSPPRCADCIIPPNAVASGGPSLVVNNKNACPITCNSGLWQTGYTCTRSVRPMHLG